MNQAGIDWGKETRDHYRFAFGENWAAFLDLINEDRIQIAEQSLKDMLEVQRLDRKRFLDVGSGSGLFSLAARRLGAVVESFDYDPECVACTAELKRRYYVGDPHWNVEQGSVLDKTYLHKLGSFDVVYSWGVLHHTGAMWQALENVIPNVAPGGKLFIAIYNDQGLASTIWKTVKRIYIRAPKVMKRLMLGIALTRLWGPTVLRDTLKGDPLRTWHSYGGKSVDRGMDAWRDVVDWVGGYPFEVAIPKEICDFYRRRGFDLLRMNSCGAGLGCNEYVFVRHSTN